MLLKETCRRIELPGVGAHHFAGFLIDAEDHGRSLVVGLVTTLKRLLLRDGVVEVLGTRDRIDVIGSGLAGEDIADLLGQFVHGHDGVVTVGAGRQDHRAVGGTAATAVGAVVAFVLIGFVIFGFRLHETDQEGGLCDHDGAFHQHAGCLEQDVCR